MEKIKLHIETLLKEYEQGYCSKWTQVQEESDPKRAIKLAYECGQHELLRQLLDDIDALQAHKENEIF